MVEFVLGYIRVEFGKLVVVFGGFCVVLNIEVAISEQRKGGATAGLKLKFVVEYDDNLHRELIEGLGLTSLYF